MTQFNGQLNSNEIFAALFNMIISQQVFAENIAGASSELVDMARVDGSLYGDTKIYYSTDVLRSFDWNDDAESSDLLKPNRPASPKQQPITLDIFRQIPITVDDYLSKRAWGNEGAFASFNSVILGWISDTKRVYDITTYNAFVGTHETTIGLQNQTVNLPEVAGNTEAQNRLEAQTIATFLANLMVDLTDVRRDFNDYGFLRAYSLDNLMVVWNSKFKNKITNLDLPTIFHNQGLLGELTEKVLPSRFFGKIDEVGGTTDGTNSTKVRTLYEIDLNDPETPMSSPSYDPKKHLFPGDLLPKNQRYEANTCYTEDEKILFKIMNKNSVPFMSAFEVGTSFFNAKSLNTNHYLTWGHNTLEHLYEYPFITVKGAGPKAAAASTMKAPSPKTTKATA